MFEVVNFISVIVAAVAKIAIGMFWYSSKVFGDKWLQLSKVTPDKDKMPVAFVGMTINAVITAFILASFAAGMHVNDIAAGLVLGLKCWIGFAMPVSFSAYFWESKPLELVMLNSGYDLVALASMGAVIGLL